jgi:hypothetical protein
MTTIYDPAKTERHDELAQKLLHKTITVSEMEELETLGRQGYAEGYERRQTPANRAPLLGGWAYRDGRRALGRIDVGGVPRKAGLAELIVEKGLDPKRGQLAVEISGREFIEKAITLPSAPTWAPMPPSIAGLGQDKRYLYPNLVMRDPGDATAVNTFRQTGSRTVTGSILRALDAVTDKADVALTLTAVTENLQQAAVLSKDVPNQVLESVDETIDFLNSETLLQVQAAVDGHCYTAINTGASFGTTGTGLIATLRNAITALRAAGFNPDLAVVNPTDSAALDLSTTGADGEYVFPLRDSGSSSPLWGLKIIERTSAAGNEPPLVIDSQAIGRLFMGVIRFEANPWEGFRKNTTDVRAEVNMVMNIRQPAAARRVAAT